MKAPICRFCKEAHWGQCPAAAPQASAAPDKPARKAVAVKALASTAPVGDGVALTSAAHPPAPKGSRKPRKGIYKASLVTEEIEVKKPRKSKGLRVKGKKAKAEVPALPAQRRPRGRPLQAEEKSSYENTKPWKKLKISRRTFYRRLKKEAVS
jgi:hypothetical protein